MLLQLFVLLWAAASAHKEDKKVKACSDNKRKKCEKAENCYWTGSMCMDGKGGDMEDKKDDKSKHDSEDYGSGKYPWNDTKSPDYWENCVRKFCDKHVWYGGIRECHWEPRYGCGCEELDETECTEEGHCEYVDDGKTGCREKIRCKELTGSECKLQAKCAMCDTGCVDRCMMGPGQKNLPVLSMSLTQQCECKLEAFF